MTVETAMGHSLQHLGILYETQADADSNHRKLQAQVKHLEDALKVLQAQVDRWQKGQAEIDRLQRLENNLTALSLTVYKMKDDVDSLKARLSNADEGEPSTEK